MMPVRQQHLRQFQSVGLAFGGMARGGLGIGAAGLPMLNAGPQLGRDDQANGQNHPARRQQCAQRTPREH